MIALDRRLHRALARRAGAWAAPPLPPAQDVERCDELKGGCAVYAACDAEDRVLYVGSVHRPHDTAGLARRIREHLREPVKRLRWRRVWVLPLRTETPREVVRDLEAVVGAELGPPWRGRLPRL